MAKSLTADKIAVTDLVAFGATIGGFHIDSHSLYSGAKNSATNTTRGVFLGDDGELAVGDDNNYLKYFKDTDDTYKLEVQANAIRFGVNNRSVETEIDEAQVSADSAQTSANSAQTAAETARTTIEQLSNMISHLVTDENGESLMTQTSDGWTFNMSSINGNLKAIEDAMSNMSDEQNDTNNALQKLVDLVDSVTKKTAYITIATDENDDPCIELGKTDNPFKVRITNTAIDFLEGSMKIAYANNNTFYSVKIITEELQIGKGPGFVWQTRASGNCGLSYIEG